MKLRRSAPIALSIIVAVLAGTSCPPRARAETAAVAGENGERPDPSASFSYGFKGGVSFAQHVGIEERNSEYTVNSRWRTGFTAGAFLYVPVTSRFGIQQEVMYVQKGSRQEIGVEILDIPAVLDVTYDMDYIEIPVFMKFALVQRDKFAIHSVAGTALSLMVRDHYSLAGVVEQAMIPIADGPATVAASVPGPVSAARYYGFRLLQGGGRSTSCRCASPTGRRRRRPISRASPSIRPTIISTAT